jgi:hypothetical protein
MSGLWLKTHNELIGKRETLRIDKLTNLYFSPCMPLIIIIIMALQPFVGPWPLFQFLDPLHNRQDALYEGSARRKASTYTQNNTNRINAHNTDIHALSEIRTHDLRVRASEDSSCLRLRNHCDRQVGLLLR